MIASSLFKKYLHKILNNREFLLLIVGIFLLMATLSPEINSDGSVRYRVVDSIINNKDIPIVKFSYVQMFLTLPLAFFAKSIGSSEEIIVAYFNSLVFLILGLGIFSAIKEKYSMEVAVRFYLFILCGSMFPHHLQLYFGEVLSSLSIALGLLLIKNRLLVSVALICVGVANTPALIVPVGLLSLILIKRHPTLILSVVVSAIVILLENYFKYGSVVGSSYLSSAEKGFETVMPYSGLPGFSYPVFFGIMSILFSFGKGLFFYIPSLVLFFDNKFVKNMKFDKLYHMSFLLFFFSLVLVYSKWWSWYGGGFWGPRFFLIICLPSSLALAVNISSPMSNKRTIVLLLIVVLSTWVGIDGVIFAQNYMDICWRNNYELEMLCWYTPEFSALWRPFVLFEVPEIVDRIVSNERFYFAMWQFAVGLYLFVNIVIVSFDIEIFPQLFKHTKGK